MSIPGDRQIIADHNNIGTVSDYEIGGQQL